MNHMMNLQAWWNDPNWLNDLDIRESKINSMRDEVRLLRKKDQSAFHAIGSTAADKVAKRRRTELGRSTLLTKMFSLSIVTLGIVVACSTTFLIVTNRLPPGGTAVSLFCIQLALAGISMLIARSVRKRKITPYYATVLRRHGIVVCPKCGYRIRESNPGAICSECGLEDPLVV